jgi:hypothetical protein
MKAKDLLAMSKSGTTQDGMKGMAGINMGNSSMHSMPAMNKGKSLGADQESMAVMDMSGASSKPCRR